MVFDSLINGGFNLNIDAGNFAAGGTVTFNGVTGAHPGA